MSTDLVYEDGLRLPLELERWLGDPDPVDRELVGRVLPPVLDVGCGPGRHVVALAAAGIPALGLDVAPSAVHLARTRGACVLERSVFDRVPGAGRWATALLLDGNAGIGGDPEALLGRLGTLVRPGGRILIEVEEPGLPAAGSGRGSRPPPGRPRGSPGRGWASMTSSTWGPPAGSRWATSGSAGAAGSGCSRPER